MRMAFQVDDLLDPTTVSIITTAISLIGAAIIAAFLGERKATQVTLAHGAKREHDMILTGTTLEGLRSDTSQYEQAIKLDVTFMGSPPVLLRHGVDEDLDGSDKKERNETDLLISHLEIGYSPVFNALKVYRRHFNSIANAVLELGKEIEDDMKKENPFEAYDSSKGPQQNWLFYPSAVRDFVDASFQKWKFQRQDLQPIHVTPTNQNTPQGTVTTFDFQWSNNIASINLEKDALKLKSYLEGLFASDFHHKLVKLFAEVPVLQSESKDVQDMLEVIKTKTRLGVPLRGYCAAGREAKPKIE